MYEKESLMVQFLSPALCSVTLLRLLPGMCAWPVNKSTSLHGSLLASDQGQKAVTEYERVRAVCQGMVLSH